MIYHMGQDLITAQHPAESLPLLCNAAITGIGIDTSGSRRISLLKILAFQYHQHQFFSRKVSEPWLKLSQYKNAGSARSDSIAARQVGSRSAHDNYSDAGMEWHG
jgi:hypothetical protein